MLRLSYKKKIIFYTSNRLSCLEWFEYLSNQEELADFAKYISFSVSGTFDEDKIEDETLNTKINKKIKELNLSESILENGIPNFKTNLYNSFLFSVGRATEGYNDHPLDIVFNLDPVIDRSILLELQKMGRTTRICSGKSIGYYVVPIINSENYIENISQYMANFIKAIIKPINDKSSGTRPHTKHEFNDICKIFHIEGYEQIEHQQIYDRVLNMAYPNITYRQAIKIISNTIPKPTNKLEYYELCKSDTRLSSEPEHVFDKFNWIEYLSIPRIYYSLDECKEAVIKLLKAQLNIHKKLRSDTCTELCNLDLKFPPNTMWSYYYDVPISDLIKDKPKSKSFIPKKKI
jgi:hypothetical protein